MCNPSLDEHDNSQVCILVCMSALRPGSRHLKLDLNNTGIERIAPKWEVLLQQIAQYRGQDAWFPMQTVLALTCYHLFPNAKTC